MEKHTTSKKKGHIAATDGVANKSKVVFPDGGECWIDGLYPIGSTVKLTAEVTVK